MLCKNLYNDNNIHIKVAPPRNTLQKFGGSLTIKEFREVNVDYTRDYNIVYPPVVSIIPLQEEVNINKMSNSRNKTLPVTNDDKSLKLSRTKPLKNHEFTLDNCMNLQYN